MVYPYLLTEVDKIYGAIPFSRLSSCIFLSMLDIKIIFEFMLQYSLARQDWFCSIFITEYDYYPDFMFFLPTEKIGWVSFSSFIISQMQWKFISLTSKKHYQVGLETTSSHGFRCCKCISF